MGKLPYAVFGEITLFGSPKTKPLRENCQSSGLDADLTWTFATKAKCAQPGMESNEAFAHVIAGKVRICEDCAQKSRAFDGNDCSS